MARHLGGAAHGTLVYTMTGAAPQMTLTATDATGMPVWSVETGDVWAAPGKLPAALVATFPDPDPNVLRDGELRAYDAAAWCSSASGSRTSSSSRWRHPEAPRLGRGLGEGGHARVVRQGSATHTVALPYRPRAGLPHAAASSAGGSRLIVGTNMPSTDRRRVMTYWLRVSRSGVPSIVSRGITDWVTLRSARAVTRPPS